LELTFDVTADIFKEITMTPEEKLKELSIELPGIPKPLGSYVPFVKTGNLIYLSGMLP
jgi:enamine deaminase RidA (YjgF/YER057c/UK114 family)